MTQSGPDGTAPLCFGPTDSSSREGDPRHIGAFFRSAEERQRLLLPFIREGFEHRERAFHIVDRRQRALHVQQHLAFPRCPDWIVCSYDLSRFDGAVGLDLLRAHPMIIVGGVLQENPLFTPPDELLREQSLR